MNESDEKRNQSRKRKIRLVFRVDEDELKYIQAKMKALHIKNREAYLRKMAIDGQCIRYDYSEFEAEMRKSNYYMGNASKSLNQIAKRVNSTQNFYADDLQDLKNQMEILQQQQVKIMKLFVKETIGEKGEKNGLHKNTPDKGDR